MRVLPDVVYKFTFTSSFNTLDKIYRVVSILSYEELLNLEVDLFETTYKANGLDEVMFNTDLGAIRSGQIFKLVDVTDESNVQYIPELIIKEVPDQSVQKYLNLGLAVNIGIFDDPAKITTIKSEVEQTLAAMLGTNNNATLYTVKESWLTTDQYVAIDTAREAAITKVDNHYTEKLALQKKVDQLQTLVDYYEATLAALNV